MNFRSRWKRCMAAVMLAGMAANGCAVYAAEAQSGTATPETAQPTVTATPETAAADVPAFASLYAAPRRAAVSTFALEEQSTDDVDTQDVSGNVIASVDFSRNNKTLPEGWKLLEADGTDYSFVADVPMVGGSALAIHHQSGKAGLVNNTLNLNSADYRTVTITEEINVQPRANSNDGRFCLLYLFDNAKDFSGDRVAYDFYTTDDWTNYAAHVGNSNDSTSLTTIDSSKWQTVTYSIDMWTNTFTVSIDDFTSGTLNARNIADTLQSLQIYTEQGTSGTVYVKSVTVTATPNDADYTKGDDSNEIETGDFKQDKDSYYGSATFYDYYGDYERAGNKLSTLTEEGVNAKQEIADAAAKMRFVGAYAIDTSYNDQSAKLWNTAISSYFYDKKVDVDPLYFGGARFFNAPVGTNLQPNLYNYTAKRTCGNGYSETPYRTIRKKADNTNEDGAFFPNQGIAADTLDENGQLLLKTKDNSTTPAPYFNKEFVRNDNNTYVQGHNGQVYEDVAFPFTWDETTSTWLFDSTQNGAQLKKDNASGGYYIDRSGNPVKYGNANYFFPFNTAGMQAEGNQAYKLDYMFGMQLELPFNLTADKMSTAPDKDGIDQKVHTVFRFAGDDDIWIYIDGKLVLDMGGSHGTVAGAIDFTTGNYMVSGQWDGQSDKASAMSNTAFWVETQNAITDDYLNQNAEFCTTGNLADTPVGKLTTGVRHTIQIFYMERGWDQSNLKMSFNFSQSSMVDVSKSVNTSHVSSTLFQDVLDDLQAQLDAETYTFRVSAQKNEKNATLQPAANSPYTLVEQGTKQTLDKNGTMQLQAGQVARFTNEFAYDSYLQISETSKANDARFTPHWTLKEIDPNGNSKTVTKKQAGIDPKDDTPLQDMPGNTPYDERAADGVAAREAGTQSLLLRPFNTGSEKVRLRIDYVNELRTGSLTLRKQLADGQTPAEGSFTLQVKFDNVGGTSVTKTVYITLDKANGYTKTLDGIPYGTTYTVYEVKQDGWELKEIQPSAAKGAQQEGVYDLYYTGTLAADTDNGRVITFRNSPVNKPTASPTPETPTGPSPSPAPDKPAGPTATPSTPNVPGNDTPAPTATPTATPSAAQGKATGSTPAPTAQVTSAIPQTEDTSHPILLCLLCVAGAFGFGIVIAKWNIRREQ